MPNVRIFAQSVPEKRHTQQNGLLKNNTWALQKQVPILYQQRDKCYVTLKMVITSQLIRHTIVKPRWRQVNSSKFTGSDYRAVDVSPCCLLCLHPKAKNRAHYVAAAAGPFFRVKMPVPVCLWQHLVFVGARCKLRYSTFNCESGTCHNKPALSQIGCILFKNAETEFPLKTPVWNGCTERQQILDSLVSFLIRSGSVWIIPWNPAFFPSLPYIEHSSGY